MRLHTLLVGNKKIFLGLFLLVLILVPRLSQALTVPVYEDGPLCHLLGGAVKPLGLCESETTTEVSLIPKSLSETVGGEMPANTIEVSLSTTANNLQAISSQFSNSMRASVYSAYTEGPLCNIFGIAVRPFGLCHREVKSNIEPETTVVSNSPSTPIAVLVPTTKPGTIHQSVVVEQVGVSEENLSNQINHLISYVNHRFDNFSPRTGTTVDQDYVLSSLDRAYDSIYERIDDIYDDITAGGTLEDTTLLSPALTDATLTGTTTVSGALQDASGSAGTVGYVLSSLGNGTAWVDPATAFSGIYFAQGGNTFGVAANLGTNDAYALNFETNNTTRLTIDSSGNIGIGTTNPAVTLAISATDALLLPVGTTTERPAGATGYIRYNTTTAQFEGYSAGVWQGLGGVIDVDQDTYITAEETPDEDTLHFYTAGTERLTIDSAGAFTVNGATTLSQLATPGLLHTDATGLLFTSLLALADIPDALITNAKLASSTVSIIAGTGLSGGGTIALGDSATLSLPGVGTAGTYGDALTIPVFTTDAQGRVSAVTSTTISGLTTSHLSATAGILGTQIATGTVANSNLANSTIAIALGTAGTDATVSGSPASLGGTLTLNLPTASALNRGLLSSADWTTFNNKQVAGDYITALTGDGTASGPGSAAFTLATVNVTTGSFGSSTAIPVFTVNGKGLITSASTAAVIAPAGTLTGDTIASNVTLSSLTTLGTITSGTWQGTPIADSYIIKTGDWEGTFNGQSASYYLALANATGTTDDLTEGTTNLFYTNARSRAALSTTATGLTYTSSTGVFSLTAGYVIPTTTEESNWNTAYSWGNHASVGYLTAANNLSDLTSTSTARTNLGVDPAGTDNSTNVTLAGIYDYLTLTGQQITLNQLDLTTDVTGLLPNTNLANSTISYGGVTLALGGSDATPAFNLTDATGLPLTTGVAGILPVANGGTGASSLTSGYLLKGNGTSAVSSSVIYDDGTNVGIGTTSPEEKLHIYGYAVSPIIESSSNTGGQIQFKNTIANYAMGITGADTGDFLFYDITHSQYLQKYIPGGSYSFFTSGLERFTIDSTGNVGIGTTSPGRKFVVNDGDIGIEGTGGTIYGPGGNYYVAVNAAVSNLYANAFSRSGGSAAYPDIYGNSGNLVLGGNSSGGGTIKFNTTGGSSPSVLIQESTGNVGIGTTSPNYKLDVNGSTHIAGNLTLNTGGYYFNLKGDNSSFRFLGGSTTGTGASLQVSGHTDSQPDEIIFYRSNGAAAIETMRIDGGTGNVGIGETTPGSKLSVSGGGSFGSGYGTTAAPTNGLIVEGNVGIGTTSPYAKLAIVGSGNTSSSYAFTVSNSDGANLISVRNDSFVTYGDSSVGGQFSFVGKNGTSFSYQFANNIGDYLSIQSNRAGSSAFAIDSLGNVGIGTTSPSSPLHIRRNVNPDAGTLIIEGNDPDIYFDDTDGGYNTFTFKNAGVPKIAIGRNASDDFYVTRNFGGSWYDNTFFISNSSGNVGIGTTSPAAKLDVQGNILTNASLASDATHLNLSGSGVVYGKIGLKASSANLFIGSDVVQDAMIIERISGNVGIGTTSPSQKLTVNGYVLITGAGNGYLKDDSNGYLLQVSSGGVNYGHYWDSTNKKLQLWTNSNARVTVDNNGNVGIGTTSPGSILEIKATTPVLAINGTDGATFKGLSFKTNGSETAIIKTESNGGELRFQTGMADAWGGFQTFYTNNLERVRITSTGNVGIGTTSAPYKFNVEGGTSSFTNASNTDDGRVIIQNANTSYTSSTTHYKIGNYTVARPAILNSSYQQGYMIGAWVDITRYGSGSADDGRLANLTGHKINIGHEATGASAVTDSVNGFSITSFANTGSITDLRQIYLEHVGSNFTNGYGIYQASSVLNNYFAGNVGIGTTSPGARLHVVGSAVNSDVAILTGANTNRGLKITTSATLSNDDTVTFNAQTSSGVLAFATNGSEKVRILNNGNVGIGTTSPGAKLHVEGENTPGTPLVALNASGSGAFQRGVRLLNSGMSANDSIMMSVGRSDNARNMGQFYFSYVGDGSTSNRISMGLHSVDDVLNILGTGNVGIGTTNPSERLTVSNGTTTGTYTTSGWVHSSDSRLKTNVAPIENALDLVNQLEGVTFNWKKTPNSDQQIGFIAQDVMDILPQVVVGNEEDGYGVSYGNITALLVQAVKELWESVQGNTESIDQLQKENDDLRRRVEQLEQHSGVSAGSGSESSVEDTTVGTSDEGVVTDTVVEEVVETTTEESTPVETTPEPVEPAVEEATLPVEGNVDVPVE